MIIRPAESADLPRLLDLLEQLRERATVGVPWPRATDEQAATAFMGISSQPGRALLIAKEDGDLVGAIDLLIVPNLTHGARPVAYIENVVVEESRRGEGVGRTLLGEAVERARAADCY